MDHPRGGEIFSETVSIDRCDRNAVGVELVKLKRSTLDVQQKALPKGYRMIAEIAGTQIRLLYQLVLIIGLVI